MAAKKNKSKISSNGNRPKTTKPVASANPQQRTYSIPDRRMEKPSFVVKQVRNGDDIEYEVSGNLNTPVPPIRDSKYLNKQQCIEIYRFMLSNRKMEVALENLYKQGKVVGGVYFGLGDRKSTRLNSSHVS